MANPVTVEVTQPKDDPNGVFLRAEFPARGRGYAKLPAVTLKAAPMRQPRPSYIDKEKQFRVWDGHSVYREVATERDAVREFWAALGYITFERSGCRDRT